MGQHRAPQQISHPEHAIHGRTDFVAHVGEEQRLCLACRPSGFIGSAQFALNLDAFASFDQQRCEVGECRNKHHLILGPGMGLVARAHAYHADNPSLHNDGCIDAATQAELHRIGSMFWRHPLVGHHVIDDHRLVERRDILICSEEV